MFAVVYSSATGRIRSIVIPDKDSELSGIVVGKGESILTLETKNYADLDQLQDIVNQKTGLMPQGDRYAIVDSLGDVKGAIIADLAAGDMIPDHELIAHPEAGEGWKYDPNAKVFVDLNPKGTPKSPVDAEPAKIDG